MEKDMLEMLKKFEELQRNMLIEKEYVNRDVKNFIKELKEIKIETKTNIDDQNLANFLGKEISRLQLIANVLYTKKLNSRIGDLVDLGQYLKELGDEFIEFGKENK